MRARTQFSFGAFYAGKFVLLGIQLPFFSAWLALNGFAAREIGLITGGALALRLLIGPLVAYWADGQSDARRALWLVSVLFAGSAIALTQPLDKPAIAAASVLLLWSFGLLVPLTDSAVMRADRAGLAHFGRLRAIGSFAFLSTAIVGGDLLTRLGLAAAAPAMALAAALTLIAGGFIPRLPSDPQSGARRFWADARRLCTSRPFIIMLLAAGLVQGAHAVYYAFSILHWTSIGYSPRIVGILWAIGVIAEIMLLTRMRALVRRLSPEQLIAAGAAGACLRWSLTAVAPPLWMLFLIQTLHALTFAATYLGAIEFIARNLPARLANTAMTINSTMGVGAITGLATIAAGYLFEAAGAAPAYFAMAGMGAAALALTLVLAREPRPTPLFQ